jgi:uncharacterized Fe-S radical SAM superfamily protein PflX
MINKEEQQLYEAYLDMFPTPNANKDIEDIEDYDKCEHIETTTDKSNYYIVCKSCGLCIEQTDIYVPDLDYLHHAKAKRYYIKTNYLKIKMKNIINFITYNETKYIINEFVKYDIIYREQQKKKIC